MKTVLFTTLIIQSGIMLIALSDPVWLGLFTMGNAIIAGVFALLMKRMENRAKEREIERAKELATALKEADKKVDMLSGNVTKIEVATNSMKDDIVAAVKKAARLEGADEERKKAAEIKAAVIEATVANVSPSTKNMGQQVADVKETVDVIDKNVEDVKGEVLKDATSVITAGVTKGIMDAKEKPK